MATGRRIRSACCLIIGWRLRRGPADVNLTPTTRALGGKSPCTMPSATSTGCRHQDRASLERLRARTTPCCGSSAFGGLARAGDASPRMADVGGHHRSRHLRCWRRPKASARPAITSLREFSVRPAGAASRRWRRCAASPTAAQRGNLQVFPMRRSTSEFATSSGRAGAYWPPGADKAARRPCWRAERRRHGADGAHEVGAAGQKPRSRSCCSPNGRAGSTVQAPEQVVFKRLI